MAVLSQNGGVVGTRWGTGRIEAFSDGVFAIAITLLILEIGVPEAAFDNLWRGIVDQWPSYLAYATSFLTIGGIWLAHHGIFRRLQYADQRVMLINLLLLMAVSFLPFPTKLMAEAIADVNDIEKQLSPFVDKPIDTPELEKALTRQVGLGWFNSLSYSLINRNDQPGLLITAEEKTTLRPGSSPVLQLMASI